MCLFIIAWMQMALGLLECYVNGSTEVSQDMERGREHLLWSVEHPRDSRKRGELQATQLLSPLIKVPGALKKVIDASVLLVSRKDTYPPRLEWARLMTYLLNIIWWKRCSGTFHPWAQENWHFHILALGSQSPCKKPAYSETAML